MRWEASVHDEREVLVLLKTAAFEPLAARLGELHPYETPEIVALNPAEVSGKYLAWIEAACGGMNEAFWLRRARREALRFNVGWSVQKFIPWVVGGGLLVAIGLIYLRSQELAIQPVWALAGVVFFVGLGVSILAARGRFFRPTMRWRGWMPTCDWQNALTSARAGVISWPAARDDARLALRWNWPRIFLPAAAAFLLIVAGVLVPIPRADATAARAIAEPSTWTAVQQRLDELKKKELVQPEAVEQFQNELDALRKQRAEKWFSHESLEAGDQLRGANGAGACGVAEAARGGIEHLRRFAKSSRKASSRLCSKRSASRCGRRSRVCRPARCR